MEIWLLVVILLVIAIILLVASLFTKNYNDVEEHFNDLFIQQSQEMNQLKTRIGELEQTFYTNKSVTQNINDSESISSPETITETTPIVNIEDVSDESRNSIVNMYSQGYTMQEIHHEVGLDHHTIQAIVDDYIENR